jgi:hypothetical protein
MTEHYKTPKVVFRSVEGEPLQLQYANAYYPGCFTMTGIEYDNPDYHRMLKWCEENNCGKPHMFDRLLFENEQQLTWFLVTWS